MQEKSNNQTPETRTAQPSNLSIQSTNAEESVDNNHSGEQLLEREQIPNSPFWIIGNRIDGYYLVLGHYRLTDVYNTKQEVVDFVNNRPWDIILGMIISVNHTDKQLQEQNVEKL